MRFGDFPGDIAREAIHEVFHTAYEKAFTKGYVLPREGAAETVNTLKGLGFRQVVFTHGSRFVERSLQVAGLTLAAFESGIADAEHLRANELDSKPSADGFIEVPKLMDLPPARVVMVGDMPNDILSGKGYGLKDAAEAQAMHAGLTIAIRGGLLLRRSCVLLNRILLSIILAKYPTCSWGKLAANGDRYLL